MLKIAELCVNLHGILEKRIILMKQIKTICLFMVVLTALTSCLGASDDDTILYDDAAITSFSLGTMNRYVNGEKTTFKGSNYLFHIDAVNYQIYNTDSLPTGTDVVHVICNISTMNNGVAYLLNETRDTLTYINATDSLDFSKPRSIIVYPSSGNGHNEYLVKVNVHQQEGDDMVWNLMTDVAFPVEPTLPTGLKQYLGKSTTEEYGLSNDNKLMVLKKDQTEWMQDLTDDAENTEMLPTEHVSLVSYPLFLSDSTDYVLMAGASTANSQRAMVWRKIVDYSKGAPKSQWTLIERNDNDKYNLPLLKDLSLVKYDDGILAFGGNYRTIYKSRDNGITWQELKNFRMPADFNYDGIQRLIVKTDANNYIWLYCDYGTTKEVWRGRINRLGWEIQ